MAEARADLLVEIGCEELPPKALSLLATSFFDNACAALDQASIVFDRGASQCLYSPRRMALLLTGVAERQSDRQLERRGPAISAAFDTNGRPTAAALGFARSVGVEVSALDRVSTEAGEWLYYRVEQAGKPLADLLFPLLQETLDTLPVPRPMRWSDHPFRFVRPVHWLVVLHGSRVLDGTLFGCAAGRQTRGHRIHAPGPHDIARPEQYAEVLRAAFVEVDPVRRRELIADGVRLAGEKSGGITRVSEDLLSEVCNLVEWPVPVSCSFDKSFLDVPQEALIASMEGHQKFFPVLVAAGGRLSASFVAVANLESRDVQQVRQGFERVVRPRLADARFFWTQDCKTPLAERLPQLDGIVFQEKLGTLSDKSRRIEALSREIAKIAGHESQVAARAALLSKCDLLSLMVNEFPELQGTMGAYYARASGEDPVVATAIGSHYQPRFSGDALPADMAGRIVSLADRLDTLVGVFGAGLRPTGNRDPFALRRAALGVIRMLLEPGLDLSLHRLVDLAAAQLAAQVTVDPITREAVLEFLLERLRQLLRDQGFAARQVQSVMAAPGTRPSDIFQRLQAVSAFTALPEGASLVAANKRIGNILKKAEDCISTTIDTNRFVLEAETILFDAVTAAKAAVEPFYEQSDYAAALGVLAALRGPVDNYFDGVMVMDDDPTLRRNRLAQLSAMKALFDRVADFSLAD